MLNNYLVQEFRSAGGSEWGTLADELSSLNVAGPIKALCLQVTASFLPSVPPVGWEDSGCGLGRNQHLPLSH